MISRRTFLYNCSTVMAACALAPVSSIGAAITSSRIHQTLDQISYSAWADQVNTRFQVRLSPRQAVELTLLKTPLSTSRLAPALTRPAFDFHHEKFSLIFSGPKDELIPPGIHRFEHEQLGRFEMYIGRVGTLDPARVRYEAVFN